MMRGARLLLLLVPLALPAQGVTRAGGWKVTFEKSGVPDSAMLIAAATPGWRFSSNAGAPGAIVYLPSLTAGRTFRVAAEVVLAGGEGTAGVGLVIAARALETAAPRYVAFIVFPDGRFSVIRLAGSQRESLVIPTADAAITKHPGGPASGTASVAHTLVLEGDERTVTFRVNGARVAQLPRAVVDPGGGVGLRIEPGASVRLMLLRLDGRAVLPSAP